MTRPQSAFLTAVVAMVLGVVLGVVGLFALTPQLSPSARDVANTLDDQGPPQPQIYGNR